MRTRTRAHKRIKARAIVYGPINFRLVAMALLKWLCSAVWLICMTSLLHLVLSDGENFVHTKRAGVRGARMSHALIL